MILNLTQKNNKQRERSLPKKKKKRNTRKGPEVGKKLVFSIN